METVDPRELPGALSEDTFWPDHIVAIPSDDGAVHLLMYVGETEQAEKPGFLFLKHAIISPQDSSQLFKSPAETAPEPEPEPAPTAWRRPERHTAVSEHAIVPEREGPRPAPILDPDLLT